MKKEKVSRPVCRHFFATQQLCPFNSIHLNPHKRITAAQVMVVDQRSPRSHELAESTMNHLRFTVVGLNRKRTAKHTLVASLIFKTRKCSFLIIGFTVSTQFKGIQTLLLSYLMQMTSLECTVSDLKVRTAALHSK